MMGFAATTREGLNTVAKVVTTEMKITRPPGIFVFPRKWATLLALCFVHARKSFVFLGLAMLLLSVNTRLFIGGGFS
jgi:hypothetical protein